MLKYLDNIFHTYVRYIISDLALTLYLFFPQLPISLDTTVGSFMLGYTTNQVP